MNNSAALHKICRKLTGECLPMAMLLLALALRQKRTEKLLITGLKFRKR